MEFREYLIDGESITGGRTALAKILGQEANTITNAKSGKRGLPNYACVILADLLKVDKLEVIAASELVTEKKPERREIWAKIIEAQIKTASSKGSRDDLVGRIGVEPMTNGLRVRCSTN